MADKSLIEWTDATWNIITGCTLVDDGCKHCYAAHLIASWPAIGNHPSRKGLARKNAAGEAKFTGEVRFNEAWLDQPLRWKKPRRIFVCAHGDLFHESVPDDWIDRVFAVMALCPQHTFQVLTKRPERARDYMTQLQAPIYWSDLAVASRKGRIGLVGDMGFLRKHDLGPLPNVWLGTSISDQASADLRIPHLLATPAAIRFVSAEPLLGEVDLHRIPHHKIARNVTIAQNALTGENGLCEQGPHLDWVITGGESGPGARPMHPDWARSLRNQCTAAGVAFFFKQWGEWTDGSGFDRAAKIVLNDGRVFQSTVDVISNDDRRNWSELAPHMMRKVGKRIAGRQLDGREWNQMPGVM